MVYVVIVSICVFRFLVSPEGLVVESAQNLTVEKSQGTEFDRRKISGHRI